MTRLDINRVIEDILDLMRAELRRHHVSLETELLPDVEPIIGARVQLQQVIANLVMNGIEAMSVVMRQPRILRISSQTNDDGNVLIAVEDSVLALIQRI